MIPDQSTSVVAMPYADVVVIVLTCVTVIITCAALVIGMMGIFGFNQIKEEAKRASIEASIQEARKASVESSLQAVEKEMQSGGRLKNMLEDRADIILAEYNRKRIDTADWGDEGRPYGD